MVRTPQSQRNKELRAEMLQLVKEKEGEFVTSWASATWQVLPVCGHD
jgi:hypothetical protein